MKQRATRLENVHSPLVDSFLACQAPPPLHTHTHTHTHTPMADTAAKLATIKAKLEAFKKDGCTFSALAPVQAELDAIDAHRFATTPPDMSCAKEVDDAYGEGGEKCVGRRSAAH